jgi:hypothetical protein
MIFHIFSADVFVFSRLTKKRFTRAYYTSVLQLALLMSRSDEFAWIAAQTLQFTVNHAYDHEFIFVAIINDVGIHLQLGSHLVRLDFGTLLF